MEETRVDLYGAGLEHPFSVVKTRLFQTRILQGLLFAAMGLPTAIGGALYEYPPVLAIGILAFLLSLFPFLDGIRIHRRMHDLRVTLDSIYLPLPKRFLEDGYRLPVHAIRKAELHESPPEPFVGFEFTTAQGVRRVALDKGLIVRWPAFVQALHSIGVEGVRPSESLHDPLTPEDIPNQLGRRRVRYLGIVAGFCFVVLVGFALAVRLTPASLALSLLVASFVLGSILLAARGVPLRVHVDGKRVSFWLFAQSKPVQFDVSQILVGAAWVRFLADRPGHKTYGPLDPEIVHLLSSLAAH